MFDKKLLADIEKYIEENYVEELKEIFNSDKFVFFENVSKLSSSFVREELNNNQNIESYLDKKVANYIKENNLYKE